MPRRMGRAIVQEMSGGGKEMISYVSEGEGESLVAVSEEVKDEENWAM